MTALTSFAGVRPRSSSTPQAELCSDRVRLKSYGFGKYLCMPANALQPLRISGCFDKREREGDELRPLVPRVEAACSEQALVRRP
jgi:hypothetical protein